MITFNEMGGKKGIEISIQFILKKLFFSTTKL